MKNLILSSVLICSAITSSVEAAPPENNPVSSQVDQSSGRFQTAEENTFEGLTERGYQRLLRDRRCRIVDFGPLSGGGLLRDGRFGVYAEGVDTGGGAYEFSLQEIRLPSNIRYKNDDVPPDEYAAAAILRCPRPPGQDGPTGETVRLFSTEIGGLSDEGPEPCIGVVLVGTRTYKLIRPASSRCPK